MDPAVHKETTFCLNLHLQEFVFQSQHSLAEQVEAQGSTRGSAPGATGCRQLLAGGPATGYTRYIYYHTRLTQFCMPYAFA